MERQQALKIIETLLYMTDHPLSEQEIAEVLDIKAFDAEAVGEMVSEIAQKYEAQSSPLKVVQVAGGVQVATRPEMAPWIRKLFKERLTVKLSPSALETLAIIAYKQPVTKSDIELIRGVEASGVIDTLMERRLLKVVGRKEALGRPLLYGTTQEFLRQFGLKHLMDLPDVSALVVPSQLAPIQPLESGDSKASSEGYPTTVTPISEPEMGEPVTAENGVTEPAIAAPKPSEHKDHA